MNLQTLRELAIGKVLGPTAVERGVDVNLAVVNAFINEAYHMVERAALWKFSEAETVINLSAGAETAAVPADLAVPLMARNDETDQELLFHDERQMFLPPGSGQPGQVEVYSVYANTFRFKPAPRAATSITLRYYKTWPDLVAETDEPIFPPTWHDILSSYAASKLALRLPPSGNRFLPASEAEPHEQAWQTGLLKMMDSPLTLTTSDNVESHHLTQSIYLGEGVDW